MTSSRTTCRAVIRRYWLMIVLIVFLIAAFGQLTTMYQESKALQTLIAELLRSEQPAIKSLRAALTEIRRSRSSPLDYEMLVAVDETASRIQAGNESNGIRVQGGVDRIVFTVYLLTITSLAILATIGLAAYAYIRERTERNRLATFPKRNPNPVAALNEDGLVTYVNDGGIFWLTSVGFDSSMSGRLLPEDVALRLAAISADEYQYWEYRIATPSGIKEMACSIQSVADYGEFHAYFTDITEKKDGARRLYQQAMHDSLTGLPNRRLFEVHLNERLRSQPSDSFSILFLSIERFSSVVQGLGGASFADQLLTAVAKRIADIFGRQATDGMSYRFDSTVFAAFLPVDCAELPYTAAERMLAELGAPFVLDEREFYFSYATGGALYPDHGGDSSTLVGNAIAAMHVSSQKGGDQVAWFDGSARRRIVQRFEIETRLRKAVARNEMRLEFQPQIDLETGRIVGSEALLRWSGAEGGAIPPSLFIPVAEESGLITSIGAWVLREACLQNKAWNDGSDMQLRIAVNISARQLESVNFSRVVRDILDETGLPADLLELEITESVAMSDVEANIGLMEELRRLGVHLSIDDFGTGYSSLSYLRRFPIEKLKIDRSFVRSMTEEADASEIARTVINLGHSLRLNVIAEGVETMAQLDMLQNYGCDEVQGYLLSRPVDARRFLQLVEEDRSRYVAICSRDPSPQALSFFGRGDPIFDQR